MNRARSFWAVRWTTSAKLDSRKLYCVSMSFDVFAHKISLSKVSVCMAFTLRYSPKIPPRRNCSRNQRLVIRTPSTFVIAFKSSDPYSRRQALVRLEQRCPASKNLAIRLFPSGFDCSDATIPDDRNSHWSATRAWLRITSPFRNAHFWNSLLKRCHSAASKEQPHRCTSFLSASIASILTLRRAH